MAGDPDAAQRRIQTVEGIDLLEIDAEVLRLSEQIVKTGLIPAKASTDAAHIAVAARHSIEYLLTWNCAHIANAEILGRMNYLVSEAGYFLPTICTPDELFGGEEYDR